MLRVESVQRTSKTQCDRDVALAPAPSAADLRSRVPEPLELCVVEGPVNDVGRSRGGGKACVRIGGRPHGAAGARSRVSGTGGSKWNTTTTRALSANNIIPFARSKVVIRHWNRLAGQRLTHRTTRY